jgi:hypothetical protein
MCQMIQSCFCGSIIILCPPLRHHHPHVLLSSIFFILIYCENEVNDSALAENVLDLPHNLTAYTEADIEALLINLIDLIITILF